jgi:DNA-binding transcriptional MerR regulator
MNNYASTLVEDVRMVERKTSKKYKTKEICDRFDISRATLFRWESEGLLLGVGRDWRGWRIYDDENLRSIEKIIKGKNSV